MQAGGPPVNWWMTDPNGPAFEAALAALRSGLRPRPGRPSAAAARIGFVGPLAELFGGAPALLLGIEDPVSNAHAPEREPARRRLQEADGLAGIPVRQPGKNGREKPQGGGFVEKIDKKKSRE